MTPDGFSEKNPDLRLAWDATCLERYMQDPLAYFWAYVQGWRSPNPAAALVWGKIWHRVTAHFRMVELALGNREAALIDTVRYAIDVCREERMDWIAVNYGKKDDDRKRNTYAMVRALIWWEAHYRNDPYRVVQTLDRPHIERHWVIPLGIKAYTGEDYLLCGSLDEVDHDEDGKQFVIERKTTTRTISSYYFETYDPSVQVFTYDLIASIMLPDQSPLNGVIIEAVQSAINFSAFERHEVKRTREQRAHWMEVLKYWIQRAEWDARHGTWPVAVNPATSVFDSVYRQIEKRTPSSWPGLLATDLTRERERWNPLEAKDVS